MLSVYPVSLIENLAPAIFACCFRAEKHKPFISETRIMILSDPRENKIRPAFSFCYFPVGKRNFLLVKNCCKMMFKGFPGTAFSPVQYASGKFNNFIEGIFPSFDIRLVNLILNETEQLIFCIKPGDKPGIRIRGSPDLIAEFS